MSLEKQKIFTEASFRLKRKEIFELSGRYLPMVAGILLLGATFDFFGYQVPYFLLLLAVVVPLAILIIYKVKKIGNKEVSRELDDRLLAKERFVSLLELAEKGVGEFDQVRSQLIANQISGLVNEIDYKSLKFEISDNARKGFYFGGILSVIFFFCLFFASIDSSLIREIEKLAKQNLELLPEEIKDQIEDLKKEIKLENFPSAAVKAGELSKKISAIDQKQQNLKKEDPTIDGKQIDGGDYKSGQRSPLPLATTTPTITPTIESENLPKEYDLQNSESAKNDQNDSNNKRDTSSGQSTGEQDSLKQENKKSDASKSKKGVDQNGEKNEERANGGSKSGNNLEGDREEQKNQSQESGGGEKSQNQSEQSKNAESSSKQTEQKLEQSGQKGQANKDKTQQKGGKNGGSLQDLANKLEQLKEQLARQQASSSQNTKDSEKNQEKSDQDGRGGANGSGQDQQSNKDNLDENKSQNGAGANDNRPGKDQNKQGRGTSEKKNEPTNKDNNLKNSGDGEDDHKKQEKNGKQDKTTSQKNSPAKGDRPEEHGGTKGETDSTEDSDLSKERDKAERSSIGKADEKVKRFDEFGEPFGGLSGEKKYRDVVIEDSGEPIDPTAELSDTGREVEAGELKEEGKKPIVNRELSKPVPFDFKREIKIPLEYRDVIK
ncbi:MAG TPA: hypothetical protein PKD37_02970 [Oligoflexia bacterium]|nr:hypothetical protein [Oligoflexia bacterium]HMP26929.1 hypothetical protein [Oligoflexia bacterium]